MAIIIGDGTANLLIGTPAPDTIRAGGLPAPGRPAPRSRAGAGDFLRCPMILGQAGAPDLT